jgi:hypothetical protein
MNLPPSTKSEHIESFYQFVICCDIPGAIDLEIPLSVKILAPQFLFSSIPPTSLHVPPPPDVAFRPPWQEDSATKSCFILPLDLFSNIQHHLLLFLNFFSIKAINVIRISRCSGGGIIAGIVDWYLHPFLFSSPNINHVSLFFFFFKISSVISAPRNDLPFRTLLTKNLYDFFIQKHIVFSCSRFVFVMDASQKHRAEENGFNQSQLDKCNKRG